MSEWVSVKDDLPNWYTTVFIYSETWHDVHIGYMEEFGTWFDDADRADQFWAEPIPGVTHWMELTWPNPPEV